MSIVSNAAWGSWVSVPGVVLTSGDYYYNVNGTTQTNVQTTSQMYILPNQMLPDHTYFLGVKMSSIPEIIASGNGVYSFWTSYYLVVEVAGVRYQFAPSTGANDVYAYMTISGVDVDNIKVWFEGQLNAASLPSGYAAKASVRVSVKNPAIYMLDYGKSAIVPSIQAGNELQQQGNQIQQEGNKLQEQGNKLQEEANQTSKNIFDKISDFFAGFFDGIINAFKSLFIPDDDYFSSYFKRLNDFFAKKLGMLYTPIDMFIKVLNAISSASTAPPGIPFPGLKWEDTYIIKPQTISLSTVAKDYPDLQQKLYFVTDIMMIGAVLSLLQNKLKEVLNR